MCATNVQCYYSTAVKLDNKVFKKFCLSCQNFYNGSQWGVYDFPMMEIGDLFGINTDLRIDPNSIPHTGQ